MRDFFFRKLLLLIKNNLKKKESTNKKDFIDFAEDEFKNLYKKNLKIPLTLFNL